MDEEDGAEKLDIFRNEIEEQVIHEFVEFDPKGGNDGKDEGLKGSTVWLGPVEQFIATIDTFEEKRITWWTSSKPL